jgi:hypothetical protein
MLLLPVSHAMSLLMCRRWDRTAAPPCLPSVEQPRCDMVPTPPSLWPGKSPSHLRSRWWERRHRLQAPLMETVCGFPDRLRSTGPWPSRRQWKRRLGKSPRHLRSRWWERWHRLQAPPMETACGFPDGLRRTGPWPSWRQWKRRLDKRDTLLWNQKQHNCFLSLLAPAASCSLLFPQLLCTMGPLAIYCSPLAICCSLEKLVEILIFFYVYLYVSSYLLPVWCDAHKNTTALYYGSSCYILLSSCYCCSLEKPMEILFFSMSTCVWAHTFYLFDVMLIKKKTNLFRFLCGILRVIAVTHSQYTASTLDLRLLIDFYWWSLSCFSWAVQCRLQIF